MGGEFPNLFLYDRTPNLPRVRLSAWEKAVGFIGGACDLDLTYLGSFMPDKAWLWGCGEQKGRINTEELGIRGIKAPKL